MKDRDVFGSLGSDDPVAVGTYTLVARIGSGGMGKVYLGYSPGGMRLAVKVIRPELADDPEFRRRFRSEVAAARRVQGVFTAPVVDSDPDGTPPWLATAYVPGPSLASAVADHGPWPAGHLLLLIAGVAEALQAVHAAGLVHRDLKPSNVLLAPDGPRVIDFGIARAADATAVTASGVMVGTPGFMAPEQVGGSPVTAAADVFALGQVAAYAALGRPAFGEGPGHAVLYRIVHEAPDLSGVPEPLRPLIAACLAKEPSERPTPARIIEWCTYLGDQPQLKRPEHWLPGAVQGETAKYGAAPGPSATTRVSGVAGAVAKPRSLRRGRIGFLAAGCALVVALGAFVAVGEWPQGVAGPAAAPGRSSSGPGPEGVASSPPSSTSASASGTAGGAAAGSTVRTTQAPPATTQAPLPGSELHSDVHLPAGYALDLSGVTLHREDSGGSDDLSYGGDSLSQPGADTMVLLDRGEKGALDTCLTETRYLGQFGVTLEQVQKGRQLCLRTPGGTVALVTYKGRSVPPSASDYVTLDIRIWRDAFTPTQ